MNKKISPSMMCADPAALVPTLRALEDGRTEYLHIDVMDGVFVPNFTLGTDYCRHMKRLCSVPLDVHLMVTEPEKKIALFPVGEGDMVSVHAESSADLTGSIEEIRRLGARAFVALNPETPVDALSPYAGIIDGVLVMCVRPGFAGQKLVEGTIEKITAVRRFLDGENRPEAEIEVDGNVSFANAEKMLAAGADIFVAGSSSVFRKDMALPEGLARLREIITA